MKTNHALARPALVAAAIGILLSACGGGGGGGGNHNPPPPPPADTAPPDTTLSATPAALSSAATASFSFTATEAGSTFESRLDGAAYAAATSPQNLTALAEGNHTFDVRAKDTAGNTDASPATYTWTVDTVAPDTQLTTTPNTTMTTQPATFGATSPGEPNATFEYSVDAAAFAAATFPLQVTGLANGSHTVRIRAKDAAGNVDATPASFTWTLAVPALDTTISGAPPAYTNATTASLTLAANMPGPRSSTTSTMPAGCRLRLRCSSRVSPRVRTQSSCAPASAERSTRRPQPPRGAST
jgi:hypothetical protein